MPEVTFEPSAERGAALDQQMRRRLADSLDYLFGRIGDQLGVSSDAAARISANVRSKPQSPHRFGAYYDMVLAVEDDDLVEARTRAQELIGLGPAPGLRVASIEDRPEAEGRARPTAVSFRSGARRGT